VLIFDYFCAVVVKIILASVSQSSGLTAAGASGGVGAAASPRDGVEKYRFIRKRWVFLLECMSRLCILVKAGTLAPLCGFDCGYHFLVCCC
jgi:hypothetical protein